MYGYKTRRDWKRLRKETEVRQIEVSADEVYSSRFEFFPEGIHLWVWEEERPHITISRWRGDLLIGFDQPVNLVYWDEPYPPARFAEALRRAVLRLEFGGHPVMAPSVDEDGADRLMVTWSMLLPPLDDGREIMAYISQAYDLVWRRAKAIMEGSDSVLLLGRDEGAGLDRLERIRLDLEERGYQAFIVKQIPDRLGESVLQKVIRLALSSDFVLMENTIASGHLYEFAHVAKLAECITVVLQEAGKGATWMFEDAYAKHSHWHRIGYEPQKIRFAAQEAVDWAERFRRDYRQHQLDRLPWLNGQDGDGLGRFIQWPEHPEVDQVEDDLPF